MKKLLYGTLLLGSSFAFTRLFSAKTSIPGSTAKGAAYEAADAYVEEQMHRLNIPGAALAIVKNNKIAHYRGFGMARPGGETPTPHTPFFIGSLTKSITALAIMQLVEAGKVELDAPVQRYLPWFRLADPAASAQMTVRHLLNQTSGLSFFASQLVLGELDSAPGATERQVRAMATIKLNRPVGERVEYCNLNYNILGLIIETVSGEDYASYVQEHVFKPLEMSRSCASKATAQQNGLAMGHRHWFGRPVPAPNLPIPLGSLPSGQLISCAEDMAHYLIAHLNGGRYAEAQILSGAGMDELHRGELEYINFGISAGKYAMGWFDLELGGRRTLTHGGNVPDFSAFMALIPGQKMGLVLLLNADPYGLPMITDEIGSNLTRVLIDQQPEPIKLDFIQWIFRLLPLIPLLQLVGAVATLRNINRWKRHPQNRPGNRQLCWQHVLLPYIPNLSLSGILFYLYRSGLMRYLRLFNPDLAWIARISGTFAGVWVGLRTWLILQILRKSEPS